MMLIEDVISGDEPEKKNVQRRHSHADFNTTHKKFARDLIHVF